MTICIFVNILFVVRTVTDSYNMIYVGHGLMHYMEKICCHYGWNNVIINRSQTINYPQIPVNGRRMSDHKTSSLPSNLLSGELKWHMNFHQVHKCIIYFKICIPISLWVLSYKKIIYIPDNAIISYISLIMLSFHIYPW